MPRRYQHIKEYEKEIESLRKEGYTSREIGNKLALVTNKCAITSTEVMLCKEKFRQEYR